MLKSISNSVLSFIRDKDIIIDPMVNYLHFETNLK